MPTKEERIAILRKAAESSTTPEHIKDNMRAMIEELEASEPDPEPVKIKKKPAPMALPHDKYFADNNIDVKTLPLEIRRKLNGLKMFIGKDSDKVRAKAPEISNNIIEMVKKHLTPSLPPKTLEEKQDLIDKYKKRREKRKQLTN